MSRPDEQLTHWQSLAKAADEGQLFLNPEAAEACSKACTTFIARLREHQTAATFLTEVSGLGEFESGKLLRDRFSQKASGGENNLVDVLQSHIDVVERMRTVFDKFFDSTTHQDEVNAAALEQRAPR